MTRATACKGGRSQERLPVVATLAGRSPTSRGIPRGGVSKRTMRLLGNISESNRRAKDWGREKNTKIEEITMCERLILLREIVYPYIPNPDEEDEGGQASSSLAISTRWISVAKLLQSGLATLAQREGGE
ncbi:hypothetical protein GW17_00057924 [Ensete ventricosum]|nr:hypothetical protein GW17_00057924 [Ensete ventricosum]